VCNEITRCDCLEELVPGSNYTLSIRMEGIDEYDYLESCTSKGKVFIDEFGQAINVHMKRSCIIILN